MRRRVILIGTIVGIAAVALALWFFLPGRVLYPPIANSNCANCHQDLDRLSKLTEQPEMYYIDSAQFGQETHSGVACTTCHGGDPTKDTPAEACLNGKAYKNPAALEVVDKTCGSCHREITGRFKTSIHANLSGIRQSLVDLLGEKDGAFKFDATCNQCHTTCSNCHMEQPDDRNILWPNVTNHHFAAHSDSKACAACHGDMGLTFFGDPANPKHAPSLMAQAGMQCADCHGDEAVHGNGTKTTFLSELPMPECQECHNQAVARVTSAKDTLVAPQFNPDTPAHKIHSTDSLSCAACHTQWYSSCWACHDGRTAKTVDTIFLAVNPLTKLVHPVAHSPATSGSSGPIPDAVGGGWAIKSRHSWGASQTCETCHTDAQVYVSGPDRQAPFVAYWSKQHMNASFVDDKLVQQLVVDTNAMKQSAHKDQTCDDCHQSVTDAVCTDCHNKTQKTGKTFLPATADWSRSAYIAAEQNLKQSADLIRQAKTSGMNVADWEQRYDTIKSSYLQVSNGFHSNPGQALAEVQSVSTTSEALLGTVRQVIQARQIQNQVLPVGAVVATSLLGTVLLSLVVRRQSKN